MYVQFSLGNLLENIHLWDQEGDGRIMLSWTLRRSHMDRKESGLGPTVGNDI